MRVLWSMNCTRTCKVETRSGGAWSVHHDRLALSSTAQHTSVNDESLVMTHYRARFLNFVPNCVLEEVRNQGQMMHSDGARLRHMAYR
jgi:hypothetical protein